jgi:hypothetical protein
MLDQALNLRKVRRTKNLLLVAIAIAMVVLILVSLVHKGLAASPLFVPFPAILYTVLMAGMLMTMVSIVFNGVEIATGDSVGRRFLSAQHGFRVSRMTGALVLILVVVFALLIPFVEDYIATDEADTLNTTRVPQHDFESRDPFDVSYVYHLTLEVHQGAPLDWAIKTKNPDTSRYTEKERGRVQPGDKLTLDLKEWPRGEYRFEFYIEDDSTAEESEYTYHVERMLNAEISHALTGFLAVIAIAHIVWTAVAYVLMKRYEVESVGGLADGEFPAQPGF